MASGITFMLAVMLLCSMDYSVKAAASPSAQDHERRIRLMSEESGVRMTRATCDLASIQISGFAFNHALCAAHCIALNRGFRGGRCINGVCNCRK